MHVPGGTPRRTSGIISSRRGAYNHTRGSPTAMATSTAQTAEVDVRRAALIALRRQRIRFDDRQILDLGYTNAGSARKDFYRAVMERKKATAAEADGYREEQTQIIEDLLDVYLPLAMEKDVKAAELSLRLLERQAKLNGYEAVLKAELSGPGGGPVPITATSLSELRELIRTSGDPDPEDDDLPDDDEDEDPDDDGADNA
jgi:hypothetical protein